jgi:predicted porin
MKKHLIAIAVGTLIATPAAFADVEVGPIALYGTFHTAVELISLAKNGATVANTDDSQTRLADQTSKLGFKTKLDLGNGSFALGQVESRFYLGSNGSNTDNKAELGGRNTFVGVGSSDAGTLRLGRYDNAYKLSSKLIGPLRDNLNDATDDTGDKQILNRLGARQGDLVAYESPNWGGFTALVSYNLGKDSTGSISGNKGDDLAKYTAATDLMNQMSIGLGYKAGDFSVGLGTTTVTNAAWQLDGSSSASVKNYRGNQELSAYQLGASYKLGGFKVGFVTERTASKLSGGFKLSTNAAGTVVQGAALAFDQNQTTNGLVLGYKSGAYTVEARYAVADDVSGSVNGANVATDTGATQYGVALAYQWHKNVQIIGSITSVDNKKNSKFTTASGFSLSNGVDMQQVAVGIAATF